MANLSQPARSFPRPASDSGAVDRAARTCELACRRLSQACLALAPLATAPVTQAGCLHAVMDCSYVAAATARLVNRIDRHDVEVIRSMVDVCAHMALTCAEACERDASTDHIVSCGDLGRECATACTQLLVRLEEPTLSGPAPGRR